MSGEELRATKVSSVALAKEALVVKRLVYKNTSQHRRDRNFQKLRRLSKGLGRLQEVQLCDLLRRQLWSRSRGSECKLQCKQQLEEVSTFLQQMAELCEECFNGCHQQLELSFFVPINLVVAAAVSRVKVLLDLQCLCIHRTLQSAGNVPSELPRPVATAHEDFGEPVVLSVDETSRREEECRMDYGTAHKHTQQVKTCHRNRLFVRLLVPTDKGCLVIKSRHSKGLSPFIAQSTHIRSTFTRLRQCLSRHTKWTIVLLME